MNYCLKSHNHQRRLSNKKSNTASINDKQQGLQINRTFDTKKALKNLTMHSKEQVPFFNPRHFKAIKQSQTFAVPFCSSRQNWQTLRRNSDAKEKRLDLERLTNEKV